MSMSETLLSDQDAAYLRILLERLEVCKLYKPQFGQGRGVGVTLDEFITLYGSDIFYSWFGLDHPLVYAAHKAAGGITSIYRQIGIGCEQLFRQILCDYCGLSVADVRWSYSTLLESGNARKLSLDARLPIAGIIDDRRRQVVKTWLRDAARQAGVADTIVSALQGVVFEVRQGYKSKDSKRQNADIANAAMAYSQGYLPVVFLLSQQIDFDIMVRYRRQNWLILRGMSSGTPFESSYAFMREIVGYDLAAFFVRCQTPLKYAVIDVFERLLNPND